VSKPRAGREIKNTNKSDGGRAESRKFIPLSVNMMSGSDAEGSRATQNKSQHNPGVGVLKRGPQGEGLTGEKSCRKEV